MVDVLNYGVIWRTIQDNVLLDWVQDTSSFFKIELGNIERDLGIIQNVRGNGTFIGFDTADARSANLIQSWMQKGGIQTARIGPSTIGLRPSLTLSPTDAAHLRRSLRNYHPNHAHNEA